MSSDTKLKVRAKRPSEQQHGRGQEQVTGLEPLQVQGLEQIKDIPNQGQKD